MEERYTSLTAIHLAGEPAFISWIYDGTGDVAWKEWMMAHPEMEPTVAEARRIVNDLKENNQYRFSEPAKSALWHRIEASVHADPKVEKTTARVRSLVRIGIMVAASLALLVWVIKPKDVSTTSTAAAEQTTITLPDQSEITINAGSKVTYQPRKFEKERRIQLDGEAFFDVEPGSQFTVETSRGSVTVLGTSFNVIARDDRFEVSCFTGKVQVENKAKQTQLLTAGNRAVDRRELKFLSQQSFEVMDSKPEWTKGRFVFFDQPLRVVVDELERQYDIKVILEPGLGELWYVGLFESGDLEEAVSLITWPLHLEANISNKTVSIARRH